MGDAGQMVSTSIILHQQAVTLWFYDFCHDRVSTTQKVSCKGALLFDTHCWRWALGRVMRKIHHLTISPWCAWSLPGLAQRMPIERLFYPTRN
jgi:hypothetical protein